MTTAATLDTNLTLNSTAFRQGMISAANQANTSLKSIQTQATQTASVLSSLNRAAALFGGFELLKGGLDSLLKAQVQLQSIQYTLLSATGNAIAAGEAMAFLRSESDKLGLSLPDTAEGFARLSAAATASGVSMSSQQELFDAFAKASSTLHLSTAQSGRALLALQEMFSRGVISARQLNQQLGQAIPGSAARFKNAVMEMVKGTDLAGKSFDQIQKSGKLITTQFLPALTIALQGAGSGWEEASQGLNANLNRLSTAWFNLKTELSGGLFSDVASNGAALLAQNLNKVAAALQLVAGVAIARGVTGLGTRAFGAVAGPVRQGAGDQIMASMATAQAESQLAMARATAIATERAALQNRVFIESAQNTLADSRAIAFRTLAMQDEAVAEIQRLRLMQVQTSEIRVLMQLDIALGVQETKLASALRARAAAQVEANAAQATAAALGAKQAGLSAVSGVAGGKLAAAEINVAKVAAAETAFNGLRASIGRAATSFGNFALSLVGGPWGVAVLAIGGLVYAFESAKSAAEHLEAQTKENAKSVDTLIKASIDLQNEFKELGNSQPLSKLKDNVDTLSAALLEHVQALAKAKAALGEMDAAQAKADETAGTQEGILRAAAAAWSKLTGEYDATKASVTELTADTERLNSNIGSAQAAYVAAYGGNWGGVDSILSSMPLTIDGVTSAFTRLRAAMNGQAEANGLVDQARVKMGQLSEEINQEAAAAAKKLAEYGKTPGQIAMMHLKQLQDAAAAGRGTVSPGDTAAAKQAKADSDNVTAQENAKKAAGAAESAAKARARAAADLAMSQQGELAAAKAQLDQTDKMVPAQKQLNEELAGGVKAYNGMTAAQKATSIATLKQAAALEEQYIAQEKAIRSTAAYVAMKENLDRVLENSRQQIADDLASISGQSAQQTADDKALESLRRNYTERQRLIDKNKEISKADAAIATADNKLELDKQLADYRSYEQKRADIQANSMNGLKAAVADFIVAQNNQMELAKKFAGDFISQFSDAFAAFASGTETAKKAFGGFIDSMYKEAWKFVADQTIKSLLLSFNAPGSAGQPGAGQGFFSNLKNSLFGGFGAGKGDTAAQAQVMATTTNTAALTALTASLEAQSGLGGLGGSSGGGSSGGGGIFGILSSLFSGGSGAADQAALLAAQMPLPGLAGGGPAGANSIHQVAENGPEMLSVGDQSYLLMGAQGGHVTPTHQLASAGRSSVVNNTYVNVHPTTTRRTADQVAAGIDQRQRMAAARNG